VSASPTARERFEAERSTLEQEAARVTAELTALRAYYDDLLSSLQDAVIILDPAGQVVSVNLAAEELTGCSRSQVSGRPIQELFPAPAPLADLVSKTLELGRSHARFDAFLVGTDGRQLPVSASASLISDAEGRTRGAVLVLRDLSRVRELEEQVRRSDRLAALGVVAAGLAHEVRNPLVGVRAAAQLLEREPDFPAPLREFTGVIIREVDRLNRLVDDLLTFAGRRPPAIAACDLNRLVDEALRLEEARLQAVRVVVVRQYDPAVPSVAGDADRLLQVFLNLVRNGAEAMQGRGGELTVRTRFERLSPQCGGRPAGVVEFTDGGPGITAEVRARLFTPFFSTKDGGTGLGLPISLRIVEEHGGALEVQSEVGHGTTLRVLLPLVGETREARG
jgi:two-component system nitrogen regulation sensor histidine kinase GlnL